MGTIRAFTCTGTTVLSKLQTDVQVHSDFRTDQSEHSLTWKAVWDTGATNTCISHRINKLTIKDVRAQALALYDCDLLIGMDIIRFGDFSVTTNNGKTIFSFRTPSIKHIDFVKELDEQEKALRL